ncbi:MAG: LysM peptidoglycan-binding domain-containing protein [Myxococcales bacterium]|nr:LysM peptidoglycan-binding domain-containing protein [Myxococcales bacterium]
MIAWTLLVLGAEAAELRAVRRGDTIESIAESLGDPALAGAIRSLNDLAAGAQPEIGQLLTLPGPTVEQVDQQAFLVSSVGDVTVQQGADSSSAGRLFTAIEADSTVCTGSDSFATLRLASSCDGEGKLADDVTLWSDTCVQLLSMVASSLGRSTVVRVLSGSVVVAEPLRGEGVGSASQVTVQAGSGVASGEGGFRVHLEPDEALRAEALTDPLAVMGAGQQQNLAAGQGSRVPFGGVPTEPIDLLGAGPLREPGPGAPLRRALFRWEPQEEAFGYQFAIATDARFTEVVYQDPVPESVHDPELLMLPLKGREGLFWRVATLDRFGFLGVPTQPRPIGLPEGILR